MSSNWIIGRYLANFRVLRHLGHGGMADVYYGYDEILQRPVAIKVLDDRYRDNSSYAKRFVREARSIASWQHENIVEVYYAGEEEGLSYFVMEYIDGNDLSVRINWYASRNKLMAHDEVIRIGRAVASALDYAHQQGVVHRDVKPSNVMLAKNGRVVLTDFGLALDMTEGSVGEVVGSANYVSPEQARNSADAVPQSDLYSLGIMLYEMLVGKLPFDDPSFTTVTIQHITTPPPPPRQLNPNLNKSTEAVLLKALHKSPTRRHRSATQLVDALEKALQKPARAASATSAASSKRTSIRAASSSKRKATPVKTSARRPGGQATRATPSLTKRPAKSSFRTAEAQAIYRQLGLIAGGVVGLILILVLVLWLLSG
jgi:serine/threonine protein kinase